MISYSVYRLIHLTGILLVFLGLGGRILQGVAGVPADARSARVVVGVTHGVGLFMVLLGGFGLLARIGISHDLAWPGWVWVKVGVWLSLGVLVALPLRFPALARPLWLLVPLLGVTAAYMAIFKPF